MSTPLVTNLEVTDAVPSFANLLPAEMTALIAAASEAVNRECDRFIGLDTYTEVYEPGRSRVIDCSQYPVSSVTRVATDINAVITVQNTSSSVQEAYIAFTTSGPEDNLTPTGLTLTSIANGVVVTTPLLFVTYPTLGPLAAAMNAIGGGWVASVAPVPSGASPGQIDFNQFLSTNLITIIGAMDAQVAPLDLRAFTRRLQYSLVPARERTRRIQLFEGRPDSFRYPDRLYSSAYGFGMAGVYGVPGDYGGVTVTYIAGWQIANVPLDIKQATIHAIQFYRERQTTSGAFKSKSIGKVSYSIMETGKLPLPDYVCAMLLPHRRCDFA